MSHTFSLQSRYGLSTVYDDYGSPHLKAQINKIITIFNMSDNMEDMWKNFEKAKSRQMNYLEPPYKFDENGHTVEE